MSIVSGAARVLLVMIGSLLIGCQADHTAEQERNMAATIAPSGTLRVAINLGNVVLAQRAAQEAAATGPSVEIANELGRRLGVPVEQIIYESAGEAVRRLPEDQWDIAFMAIDPKRAETIAFTQPYVFIESTYMVRADAPYRTLEDVDRPGVRIAVGRGAAYDLVLTRTLAHAEIERFDTSPIAIEQFHEQKLEAVAGVRQALEQASAGDDGLRLIPGSIDRIDQAMALPIGRSRGLPYVDAMIAELKESGFVRAALDRAGQQNVPVAN